MAKDFVSKIDTSYPIPYEAMVMDGSSPIDTRFICDSIEDFNSIASAGMEIRYEGLITYEKESEKLLCCKKQDGSFVWEEVGSGSAAIANEIELRKTENAIEWKLSNEEHWKTLVLLDDLRGATGPVGPRGPQGEQGIQGETGPKGETGERGLPGERGPKGETGQTGEAGRDGIDGKDGKDGKDATPAVAIGNLPPTNGEVVWIDTGSEGDVNYDVMSILMDHIENHPGSSDGNEPEGGGNLTEEQVELLNKVPLIEEDLNRLKEEVKLHEHEEFEQINQNRVDIQNLFTSVDSGKALIESTIIEKGGTISKDGEVPTFEELKDGINTIESDGVGEGHVCKEDGRDAIYEALIAKLPSLVNKITPDSSLRDYAFYIGMIGEMLFTNNEYIPELSIDRFNRTITLNQVVATMEDKVMDEHFINQTINFDFISIERPTRELTLTRIDDFVENRSKIEFIEYGYVVNTNNYNKENFIFNSEDITFSKNNLTLQEKENSHKATANKDKFENYNLYSFELLNKNEYNNLSELTLEEKVVSNGPIKENLICWLDGKDGSNVEKTSTWIDKSNNNNHATLTGLEFNSVSGWTGEGLKLKGETDSYNIDLADTNTSITFEIKACGYKNRYSGFNDFMESDTDSPSIYFTDTNVLTFKWGSSTRPTLTLPSNGVLSANNTHHAFFIVDREKNKISIDVKVNNKNRITNTVTLTDTSLNIFENLKSNFSFIFKSIRIYDKALTEKEIINNYNYEQFIDQGGVIENE